MASILFVNMPVAAIERPTIALGTLKAILERAGHKSSVAYANLWYTEHVGLDRIQMIESTRPQDGLGDWLFAAAAFPDFDADDAGYVRMILDHHPSLTTHPSFNVDALFTLKRQSAAFLENAAARILEQRPKIVGCTSMFQQHVASLALLRRLRELDPGIVTIMGGANCETVMGRTTHQHFPWVDYVVSGEGDELVVDLIEGALKYGRHLPPEHAPFGVFVPCHRSEGYPAGKGGGGLARAIVDDIRVVPTPDYSDYFSELGRFLYSSDVLPGLPIETSRGCWWGAKSHCTFCGLNGSSMNFRAKPAEQALNDVETLVARHGIRRIQAVDNILDNAYVAELLPALEKRKQPLSVFYEVKANLKRHQIEALAKAGVRMVQPGIESLDSRVLKLMRKGTSAWQNLLLLKWARQYGLGLAWTIIVGFPDEDDSWHGETARLLPLLHHLQPGGLTRLRYDRYSPYFRDQARWNLQLRAGSVYRHLYPLVADQRDEIAYFMEDTGPRTSMDSIVGSGPGLEALAAAHRHWKVANRNAGPPNWKFPVLSMVRLADGGAVITDTRSCAVQRQTTIDLCDLELLDGADQAPTLAKLLEHVSASRNEGSGALEARLEQLSASGFVIRVDGRIVSLVLDEPIPPRPLLRERAAGYVRTANSQRRMAKILHLDNAAAE